MSVVGISFGSISSGAGFDVSSTVSSIVGNLQAVETPWKNAIASLASQTTAFTSLGSNLSTLSTSLQSLTDFQGVMASKLGSSSDTNVLALSSASATAVAGNHSVVVSQLAQTSSEYTSAVAASDTLSGGLSIQVGSGSAQTVPVVSGSSDTLSTYAAAINSADLGVTAQIVSDSSGSRLSIVSNTSGAAGQLTIGGSLTDSTTSSAISVTTGLTGQDAQLTVDGVSVDSASNTVSTAIPGVTMQLVSAAPNTTVQLQVVNDTSTIESAFSSLVSAYNTVVSAITTQEGNDSSGNAEPLYGNPVLSQIQSSLSLALTSGAASGNIGSLAQLGVSVNQDGTLSLDTSTLDSALSSNYSDVVGFLQNDGGFGQTMQNTLDQLGSSSQDGAISLALAENSQQTTTYNNEISAQDTLISAEQANLTTELNQANETLQAIPTQLNEIDMLYSSISGYNAPQGS